MAREPHEETAQDRDRGPGQSLRQDRDGGAGQSVGLDLVRDPRRDRGSSSSEDAQQVALTAALLEESGDLDALASRLSLLADPRRLRILFCVHACPGIRSSDIARAVEGRESTTSHALALLRDAGWIRADKEGREVRYTLADPVAHRILHEVGSAHLPGIEHVDEHVHVHAHAHGHEAGRQPGDGSDAEIGGGALPAHLPTDARD